MKELSLLPKAHLHVHLESTVRRSTLEAIGGAHVPPRPQVFGGFREFGDHIAQVRGCLTEAAHFRRIAREFCQDEAAQGTRYAELTFTAAAHGERLGAMEMPLEAVLEGLAEGQAAYGIEVRVLLDHSRRRTGERAWQTLKLATRYDEVIGLGLAGDESHPLAPFADMLDAARDAGLRLVHHAGETSGAASIREALTVGHAERLGHGIRVLDDPDLVAAVRERRIPLEVCPFSNVMLGLVDSPALHPLPRLREAGLVVTLNTDGETSLLSEYEQARDLFGYGDAVMAELATASIDASFASAATKARVRREIGAWMVQE